MYIITYQLITLSQHYLERLIKVKRSNPAIDLFTSQTIKISLFFAINIIFPQTQISYHLALLMWPMAV